MLLTLFLLARDCVQSEVIDVHLNPVCWIRHPPEAGLSRHRSGGSVSPLDLLPMSFRLCLCLCQSCGARMSLIIHKMMMAPCQHQDAIDGGVMHRFGKLLWAVKRAAMDVHASCLAHHRARGCAPSSTPAASVSASASRQRLRLASG